MSSNRLYITKNVIELYASLRHAIEQAGGNPDFICSPKELQYQTALELLANLAVNNIRFFYNGKGETPGGPNEN